MQGIDVAEALHPVRARMVVPMKSAMSRMPMNTPSTTVVVLAISGSCGERSMDKGNLGVERRKRAFGHELLFPKKSSYFYSINQAF